MKIIVFDLDDTLIQEEEYAKSGFKFIANKINKEFSIKLINAELNKINKKNGRGKIFNIFFETFTKKKNIEKYIKLYRQHYPNIKLKPEAKKLLTLLKKKNYSTYLLTDGHRIAQRQKIQKLKLGRFFKKIFVTHEFGVNKMKPNLHCFKIIKKKEKVKWSEIIYVGDNPNKDFINLNSVGAVTIRVLTGPFKKMITNKKFDAKYKVNNLSKIDLNLFD